MEQGKLEPISKALNATDPSKYEKLNEYRSWMMQQFNGFKAVLKEFVASEDEKIQVLAIRTMLEVRISTFL